MSLGFADEVRDAVDVTDSDSVVDREAVAVEDSVSVALVVMECVTLFVDVAVLVAVRVALIVDVTVLVTVPEADGDSDGVGEALPDRDGLLRVVERVPCPAASVIGTVPRTATRHKTAKTMRRRRKRSATAVADAAMHLLCFISLFLSSFNF